MVVLIQCSSGAAEEIFTREFHLPALLLRLFTDNVPKLVLVILGASDLRSELNLDLYWFTHIFLVGINSRSRVPDL